MALVRFRESIKNVWPVSCLWPVAVPCASVRVRVPRVDRRADPARVVPSSGVVSPGRACPSCVDSLRRAPVRAMNSRS